MIPDYSNLIKDIESLRSRGYKIAGVELNPITLQFLAGSTSLKPINAEGTDAEEEIAEIYGLPVFPDRQLPFGQYRIHTREPYQPQLREDFHK